MKPSKKSKSHSEMLICNIPLVYIFLLSDVNPAEFFMKSDLYVDLGFFYIKVEHRWRALTVCIWLNVSFYWPPCYRAGLRCMCMCNVRKHMECVTQTESGLTQAAFGQWYYLSSLATPCTSSPIQFPGLSLTVSEGSLTQSFMKMKGLGRPETLLWDTLHTVSYSCLEQTT